ncbi:interleukin-32 [Notamacropus eugenii]|uniref:interleukin-32 n=1 Tax=Notamacropus eugenii TaxID=9315 RepID=UPI003B6714BA
MCYSKIPVTSMKDLRRRMHQTVDSFLEEVEKMPNQDDDSTTVNNLHQLASQYEEDINNLLMDTADAEIQKQNEDHAGNPIFEMLKLRLKMKNFDSSSDEPITGDTILEKALCVWESMLKRIKSWWKKLLDFLKEIVAVLGEIANSIIEAVHKVWKWLVNLF